MSKAIESAIRATVTALIAELATGKASRRQGLTQQAMEAADRAVAANSGRNTQARTRRPR